jgi:hypothetical protein
LRCILNFCSYLYYLIGVIQTKIVIKGLLERKSMLVEPDAQENHHAEAKNVAMLITCVIAVRQRHWHRSVPTPFGTRAALGCFITF